MDVSPQTARSLPVDRNVEAFAPATVPAAPRACRRKAAVKTNGHLTLSAAPAVQWPARGSERRGFGCRSGLGTRHQEVAAMSRPKDEFPSAEEGLALHARLRDLDP